jgi:hypothetical protein
MNKKYTAALAMTAMVASSLFALSALADTTAPTPTTAPEGRSEGRGLGMMKKGMGERGMIGTVASVNGTSFTISVKARPQKGAPTTTATSLTYTVDATKATIMKAGATSTASAITVGDTVMVLGPVTGTTIAAVRVMDGLPQMGARKDGTGDTNGTKPAPILTGNGQPVVAGSVTAVSGNTVTITNKSNVTYTVDATNAKIDKAGALSTVANITVGDMIVAQGTVNGNAITASSIMDQGSTPTTQTQAHENDNQGTAPAPHKGFFGKIGGFFGNLFGF